MTSYHDTNPNLEPTERPWDYDGPISDFRLMAGIGSNDVAYPDPEGPVERDDREDVADDDRDRKIDAQRDEYQSDTVELNSYGFSATFDCTHAINDTDAVAIARNAARKAGMKGEIDFDIYRHDPQADSDFTAFHGRFFVP